MPQKSSPNISFVKILFFLGVCVFGLAGYFFVKTYFKVQIIQVHEEGKSHLLHIRGIDAISDYNLILSSTSKLANFLKASNPTIKSIEIKKQLPNQITIILSFYRPFASLKGDRGYFIISSDGTILSTSKDPSSVLPQITYYQLLSMSEYKVGNKLDFDDIKSALTFLQSSLDLGLKTSKIEIIGYHMIALYADKEKIIFSQEKDINTQKYQFETIIKEFRAQNKSFKSLDVRFDKPVVVF